VLGILGKDPFDKDIDIIKGKLLKNRKIVVKNYTSVAEVELCHLLFISSSEKAQLDQILAQLEKRPILTVSEMESEIASRAMINLYVDGKFLAFDIDKEAADRAGLKLDTQLLRLARATKKNKGTTP
jgi:hypothetical protein